jgi:hypothetical protein
LADQFVCPICGKEHSGLPTDWAYKLPDEVWAIPEAERSHVARFNDDLCEWGDRRFIRCVLELPFTERDGSFGWGAWAEVELAVYERYNELYDEDAWGEPLKSGSLANNLPAYAENTVRHPVLIQFRDPTTRPSLQLPPDDTSSVATEQRQEIDARRYHEILDAIGA